MAGLFIVFEGVDFSGKTTQLRLLAERLYREPGNFVHVTREPGGTPMAGEIRKTILAKRDEAVDPVTELLLYNAARRQHAHDIKESLDHGFIVLCDRFTQSTRAYQMAAGKCREEDIDYLEKMVVGGCKPDLTFYLKISLEECLARKARANGSELDRKDLEGDRYKQAVIDYYNSSSSMLTINGHQDPDIIAEQIYMTVRNAIRCQKLNDSL
jgi:dTMP kinase